jgi:dTDP-4-dehydro-6-deoxy-alpha-D-glucopyranose 2,3-dehydratase
MSQVSQSGNYFEHKNNAVRRVSRSDCEAWGEVGGAYAHKSGRFFRVIGARSEGRDRVMLDQPEIGLLAFLAAPTLAGYSYLIQWKAEPGNVGLVQAGPTVQATRSNIEQVHGGLPTVLLEEVLDSTGRVSDVLGSEQGDRFLLKANRDVLRVLSDAGEAGARQGLRDHEWVDHSRLTEMLRTDFLVNTDARSVLSVSPWRMLAQESTALFRPLVELLDVRTGIVQRSQDIFDSSRCAAAERVLRAVDRDRPEATIAPLESLKGHWIDEQGIHGPNGESVLGWFDVSLPTREVQRWCQPLLMQDRATRCVLVVAVDADRLVLGLRVTIEPGWTRAEFGPTLQTGHSDRLLSSFDERDELRVLAAIHQSDEGGRFYRSVVNYEICFYEGDLSRFGPDVVWLTLAETESFAMRSNATTNELRSCISLLLAFA